VPFPKGNGKWLVSTNGGDEPRWRRDGKELFYVSADLKMTAVEVQEKGSSLEFGNPIALFSTRLAVGLITDYDVTADGKNFVIVTSQSTEASAQPFTLVVNWPALLNNK